MLLDQIAQRLEPKALAPRCLVVDDDATVRHSIARVIELMGLSAMQAGSAEEGLERLAEEGEVPLIVSDVNMTGLNGLGFLEEIV